MLVLDPPTLQCKLQWGISQKIISGYNFWLECPTKVRSTQLSHIFKALIRATPLAHRFCISGSRWQVAGGQVVRWQVAGGKKTITYYPACRVGDLAMRKYVRKSNLFKICIAAVPSHNVAGWIRQIHPGISETRYYPASQTKIQIDSTTNKKQTNKQIFSEMMVY